MADLTISRYLRTYTGGQDITYKVDKKDDILDVLLELNCDSLINKILHYLSRVPIQYSYQKMQPKLKNLATYSRFIDYISAWPQQNYQMRTTRVLYTDMDSGLNYLGENCSFLNKDFYERNPTA